MARYIDADIVREKIKALYEHHIEMRNFSADGACSDCLSFLDDTPTAEVVPKSEVDNLEYTLMGVMHSVDKWLEGDELKQDEVSRAITMREKTLRIIENLKAEVVREIFEDFKQYISAQKIGAFNCIYINDVIYEIKKKYTEKDGE